MRMAATEAAALAAQKAVEAVQSATSSKASAEDSKSWWKLLPKPPCFDQRQKSLDGRNALGYLNNI